MVFNCLILCSKSSSFAHSGCLLNLFNNFISFRLANMFFFFFVVVVWLLWLHLVFSFFVVICVVQLFRNIIHFFNQ